MRCLEYVSVVMYVSLFPEVTGQRLWFTRPVRPGDGAFCLAVGDGKHPGEGKGCVCVCVKEDNAVYRDEMKGWLW